MSLIEIKEEIIKYIKLSIILCYGDKLGLMTKDELRELNEWFIARNRKFHAKFSSKIISKKIT